MYHSSKTTWGEVVFLISLAIVIAFLGALLYGWVFWLFWNKLLIGWLGLNLPYLTYWLAVLIW